MSTVKSEPEPSISPATSARPAHARRVWLRYAVALVLAVAGAVYTVELVLGHVPHPLDTSALLFLLLIGVTIVTLVYPNAFRRVKSLGVGNFRMELDEIRLEQHLQRHTVDGIASVLPLLMTEAERKLLLDLGRNAWRGREAAQGVRSQLRQLRDMRLLKMRRKEDTIHGIPAGPVDLLDFVKVTEMGNNFVRELERIELEKAESAAKSS
jgi:hypothetical protein